MIISSILASKHSRLYITSFLLLQGDTLQNVAKELDKILETGYYSFELPIDGEARMTLEYTPCGKQTLIMDDSINDRATVPESDSTILTQIDQPVDVEESVGIETKQEQWNFEQISDFVRKLGFMSTEKEGGEKIKQFRYISDVSLSIIESFKLLLHSVCSIFKDCIPPAGTLWSTKGPGPP